MHHRSLRINRRLLPSGLTVPAPRTRAKALTRAVAEALTDAVLGARDIHVVTYTIGVVTIGGAIETLTS